MWLATGNTVGNIYYLTTTKQLVTATTLWNTNYKHLWPFKSQKQCTLLLLCLHSNYKICNQKFFFNNWLLIVLSLELQFVSQSVWFYHKTISVVGTLMLKRLTNGALSLCHLQTTAAVPGYKIVPRWVYNTTYSSVTYFQKLIEIFTNNKEKKFYLSQRYNSFEFKR